MASERRRNLADFEIIVPRLPDSFLQILRSIPRPDGDLLHPLAKKGDEVRHGQPILDFHVACPVAEVFDQKIHRGTVVAEGDCKQMHVAESDSSKSLYAARPFMRDELTFEYLEAYEGYSRQQYEDLILERFTAPYRSLRFLCNLIHPVVEKAIPHVSANKFINSELEQYRARIRWLTY